VCQTRRLFWVCWRGRSCRQEAKLSHHADIVTSRVVVHDLSIAQLKPVDMLYLKVLLRGLDSHEHAAVHGKFSYSTMRAANLAAHRHGVSLGNHLLDVVVVVRKRCVNVFQYVPHPLAPSWTTDILRVLCEIQDRRLDVAPVNAFDEVADYVFIPLHIVRCLT